MAVALAALAGACTHHSARTARATGAAPSSTTAAGPATYPLTGLPADDLERARRPALVVKVDNEAPGRPQAGLPAADVVYEELIEGGDTRFAAVFQSTDADVVGPIRSVRPTDPDLVAPLDGLFAYSGGTPKFVAALHAVPVVDVGESAAPGAYFSRPGRVAPHRLFSSTGRLYATPSASGAKPPPRLFVFSAPGVPFAPPDSAPVARVEVTVGNQQVAYDWDPAAGWRRSVAGHPQVADGDGQLTATNVIVQAVSWEPSPGDVDVAHAPVFVARLVGSGDAWVFSGGRMVKARWSKADARSPISYVGPDGRPLAIQPGRTWVELASADHPPTAR